MRHCPGGEGTKEGLCDPEVIFFADAPPRSNESHCLDAKGTKYKRWVLQSNIYGSDAPLPRSGRRKRWILGLNRVFSRAQVKGAKESRNDLLPVVFCGCVTARGEVAKEGLCDPKVIFLRTRHCAAMKGARDGFCSPTHLFLRISRCLDAKGAKNGFFSPILMVWMSHYPEVKGAKDGI